jgi:hypothetical protein
MFNKLYAFIKKDFLIETSYPLAFVANIFNVAVALLTYYFIDKLFGNTMAPALQEFGVNYFSYVLLSVAFFNYIGTGLGSFSSRIGFEQTQGTLESLVLTPHAYRTYFSQHGPLEHAFRYRRNGPFHRHGNPFF